MMRNNMYICYVYINVAGGKVILRNKYSNAVLCRRLNVWRALEYIHKFKLCSYLGREIHW